LTLASGRISKTMLRRRFLRRWQNWVGIILTVGFVFIAITAPLLSKSDPGEPSPIKVVGKSYNFKFLGINKSKMLCKSVLISYLYYPPHNTF